MKDLAPWWMSRPAMISILGLALAAVTAVGLGFFIPRQVAEEFLSAQASADQAALDFLLSSDSLPLGGELSYADLDRYVRQALDNGDFVRVKLWSLDGTILYSDAEQLVGRQFETDEDFSTMKEPLSHISDLEQEENVGEADQFEGSLLETYVPVVDNGETVAVWEVYRSLEGYERSVNSTRRVVWLSVGSGLVLLGVFLATSFTILVRTASEKRDEALTRSSELSDLLRVAQATTAAPDPDSLAAVLADRTGDIEGLSGIRVVAQKPDGTQRLLMEQGSTDSSASDGVVTAFSTSPGAEVETAIYHRSSVSDPSTLQALAEEVSVGFHKAILTEGLAEYQEQLERVMEKMVELEEGERRRLAGDLHDTVGQDLYRILFGLRGLQMSAPEAIKPEFEALEEAAIKSNEALRRVLRDLHPTVAEDVGLAAAMASLVDRVEEDYGLDVLANLADCPEPDSKVKLAVFRIAQEALVNVAKHTRSQRAWVSVVGQDGRVVVEVRDEGGAVAAAPTPGVGMWLIRERAESLGGEIWFDTTGGSLAVRAALPLEVSGVDA